MFEKAQASGFKNTPLLPQQNQYPNPAKAYGLRKPFEGGAGRVLLPKGEESEA
jgi:hypothetical protein